MIQQRYPAAARPDITLGSCGPEAIYITTTAHRQPARSLLDAACPFVRTVLPSEANDATPLAVSERSPARAATARPGRQASCALPAPACQALAASYQPL